MTQCECGLCETEPHDSDCAAHNAPEAPNGECDCKGEWIRISDYPPKCWDHVLMYRDGSCMTPISVGYLVERDDGANVWHFDGTTQHWPEGTFTHWQPLTKSPPGAKHHDRKDRR